MRHLLHIFPSFDLGGQQVRLLDIARGFRTRARHTVVALDGRTGCADRLRAVAQATVIPLPMDKGRTLSNLRRWSRLLGVVGADTLCTYNWGSIEWALANRLGPRLPHLHFEDGFGPDEGPDRQHPRRVLARRYVLSGRGSRVVVPSHTLHRVATDAWRLPPSRLHLVTNGIELDRFATQPDGELVRRFGLADGLVVGCVGALRPEKNVARLVRAMALLPEGSGAKLCVVGDGPERPGLEALARELGICGRVIFAGRLERPERLLGRFDVFALSSDTEQMPYGILEAMAAGRAVAATDVGDVSRMVAGENQPFLVPAAGPEPLAAALSRLLADPALRVRLGAENRRKAWAEYGLDSMLGTYAGLFGLAPTRQATAYAG